MINGKNLLASTFLPQLLAAASQNFFCLQNVLASTSRCFRLPIGGRRQNFVLEAEFIGCHRQSGGECHWARRQKIFWGQVDLEIAYSGFRLPFGGGNQKFYLEAECFGGHRQSGGESH